ncbi:MAG: hypothetical protein HY921_08695 [Elusimicrobia bacterium]|nr:hypothetical protein [Elusimicrobiota bacterium]
MKSLRSLALMALAGLPGAALAHEAAPLPIQGAPRMDMSAFNLGMASQLFSKGTEPDAKHLAGSYYLVAIAARKNKALYNGEGLYQPMERRNDAGQLISSNSIIPRLKFRIALQAFGLTPRWVLYTNKLDPGQLGRYVTKVLQTKSGDSDAPFGEILISVAGGSIAFEWTYTQPADGDKPEASCRQSYRCRFVDDKKESLLCKILHTHYTGEALTFADIYYEGYSLAQRYQGAEAFE